VFVVVRGLMVINDDHGSICRGVIAHPLKNNAFGKRLVSVIAVEEAFGPKKNVRKWRSPRNACAVMGPVTPRIQ